MRSNSVDCNYSHVDVIKISINLSLIFDNSSTNLYAFCMCVCLNIQALVFIMIYISSLQSHEDIIKATEDDNNALYIEPNSYCKQ